MTPVIHPRVFVYSAVSHRSVTTLAFTSNRFFFVNLNFVFVTSKMNSFLSACEEGNFEKAKTMLRYDSETRKRLLRLTNPYGWNCLHFAAYYGHVEFIRYLLTLKELDTTLKDRRGMTAFHRALQRQRNANMIADPHGQQILIYQPEPTIQILKMLFEVNNNFINCCDTYNVSPLRTALSYHHLDVVKLLIDFGSSVNHKNKHGSSELHIAAFLRRVDCIRYLLYETYCDPSIPDAHGWLAVCKFIKSLVLNRIPSVEEIKFCVEFSWLSFENPAGTVDVYFLLLDCFTYRENHGHMVFMEIVTKLLLPKHPKKHLVDRILQAELPSDYCLITMALFEVIKNRIDQCELIPAVTKLYMQYFEDMKSHFLLELYTLQTVDEPLFNDYIAEAVRNGWKFNEMRLMSKFCSTLTKEASSQSVFDFMKTLIRHGFVFMDSFEAGLSLLPSYLSDHFLNVFAPLARNVNAPIEIVRVFGSQKCHIHFEYTEADNAVNVYKKLLERKCGRHEVVPLRNLSRTIVRKYVFHNHTHYEALKLLYTVNIPQELRQFLCYNYLDLKF